MPRFTRSALMSFIFLQCDGRERIKMNNRVHRNCTEVSPEVVNAKIGPGAAAQSGDDVDRTISTPAVRIVWMWWAQGWRQAPPIVRACASSWERANPTWSVRRLTMTDLHTTSLAAVAAALGTYSHLPKPTTPAYSDILRTELVGVHGGLWVDATIFCIQPIDVWMAPVLNGSTEGGFFGVRYTPNGDNEVVSFLFYARRPANVAVQLLRYNLRLFWNRPHVISTFNVFDPKYFFWCQLFGCLVGQSPSFRRVYEAIPHLPGARGDDTPNFFALRQYCLQHIQLTAEDRAFVEEGPFFKLSSKQNLWSASRCGQLISKNKLARARSSNESVYRFFVDSG